MKTKTGTFDEFKEHTLTIVRGERMVDPAEPKRWMERVGASARQPGQLGDTSAAVQSDQ